jgi:hypothetical protein
MSILDTDTIEERSDKAVMDWLMGPMKIEDPTIIRFLGAFETLPKLTADMLGGIALTNETETYMAIQTNGGGMRWMRLSEPPTYYEPLSINYFDDIL